MHLKRPAAGLAFCLFYLASCFTNKYVLSVLKFTYPTLFQGWQTLVGGFLLHISWKIGWVEISSSSRSDVLSWLPASALFVGIIYSGSRALSRLPIPIFLTLHNAAEVITCGTEKFVHKEQTPLLKICGVLILLVAAGCLPLYDPEFDTDGYFWAFVHLLCVGAYKIYHKSWRSSSLSDSEQQYINYAFSVLLLAFASHPTGDLFSALEFPFLYFYRFHSSCFASGLLGFLLTLHTIKLKSSTSSGQYAVWSFLAKGTVRFLFYLIKSVPGRMYSDSDTTNFSREYKIWFQKHVLVSEDDGGKKIDAGKYLGWPDHNKWSLPITTLIVMSLLCVYMMLYSLTTQSRIQDYSEVVTAGLSLFFFKITVNVPIACCLLLGGFAEVLLLYAERAGA